MELRKLATLMGLFTAAVGLGLLAYALVIYPRLAASYGAADQYLLSEENGYTHFLSLYSEHGLSFEVKANITVQAWVKGVKLGEGAAFFSNLPPGHHVVALTSTGPAAVEVHLRPLLPPHLTWAGGAALTLGLLVMAGSEARGLLERRRKP